MKCGNGIKDRDDKSTGIEILMVQAFVKNGIKDRDDKSTGIETLMTEVFVEVFFKINPSDPLMLIKKAARRTRN